MANYSSRTITTVRREYFLPSPTTWGELHKLIAVVTAELGDDARWDTAATVEARDDEIVISFQASKKVS